MKRTQAFLGAVLAGGLLGGAPSGAGASGLELRVGGMRPAAKSILFDDSVDLYTVRKKDFEGGFGGAEFTQGLGRNIELGFSVDGYAREIPTSYRNYTRPSGKEIDQTLRFVIVPVSALIRLVPGGRYTKFAPYVGAGVSSIYWRYEEFGDFIDFDQRGFPVVADSFKSTGVTVGFLLNAGLRYRINEDFQALVDFRNFSGKQKAGGDFAPNQVDVSGAALSIGVRLRF